MGGAKNKRNAARRPNRGVDRQRMRERNRAARQAQLAAEAEAAASEREEQDRLGSLRASPQLQGMFGDARDGAPRVITLQRDEPRRPELRERRGIGFDFDPDDYYHHWVRWLNHPDNAEVRREYMVAVRTGELGPAETQREHVARFERWAVFRNINWL